MQSKSLKTTLSFDDLIHHHGSAKILAVDDNQKNIQVIGQLLKNTSWCSLSVCLESEKAIKLASKIHPDIILLAFYSGNDISDNVKSLSQKKYRPYFLFNGDKIIDVDSSFLDSKPYKILSSHPGQAFIKLSQYSRILQLLREAYVQTYFKNQKKKKKIKQEQSSVNKSNLYSPISSDWSNAWVTTEKIINLINNEVKINNKDFILVSLTTPVQVNPNINEVEKYMIKNYINDIFYPEKRLRKFSEKNSIKYIELAQKMSDLARNNNIYFHGFNNTKLGTGHWNKTGHHQASKLISESICKFY